MSFRSLLLTAVIVLGGCKVMPVPFTAEEISSKTSADLQQLTRDQVPVTGPISLHEAIARALNYNLEFRLKLKQEQLELTRLDVANYEMLPEFVANLGYDDRSNDSGASSQSLLTKQESLEPSTSSDRNVKTNNLTLSWNILDFGLSYVRANQAADKVLIAQEQQRKVINEIVRDVRTAYWRAVSYFRLIDRLQALNTRVSDALKASRTIEQRALDKPLTALTYQRKLISIMRDIIKLQRQLSVAKIELGTLMNLQPGQAYEIVIPDRTAAPPELDTTISEMEQLALENRAELRQAYYEERINAQEARAAILALLPGIHIDLVDEYSSNSFLYNNDWVTFGARISWNLLNVFKLPATRRSIDAQDDVIHNRQLALSMAVLTQLHVSLASFKTAKQEFQLATDYLTTQDRILLQVKAGSQRSVSEQTLIIEEMNTLLAEIELDVAYADLQNTYATLLAAKGRDPVTEVAANNNDIQGYTRVIQEQLEY